ncbi:sugar phosphate isomerase/epimerase family protein [Paracoccus litorisediminis]|uniref:TIM barrel protein n=1 Tax=Paracoccus litorisediminis TaxID=2006130 RepID=A0A844HNV4_9RHOB|nr:TIM barrel protein [Paracoccus litorisediminis]MTH62033.1 TIM barrel protein [Paracoccus litorisediminis]
MSHPLGMAYLTLGDLDPMDMVVAAAEGGFGATGLRLTGHRPGDPWPLDPSDADQVLRLRDRARAAGILIANACTYRFTPDTDPSDYLAVLRACETLGTATMIANAACEDQALAARNLAAVADMAADHGIRIAFEFIPVSTVPSLGAALRLIEMTDRSNVGLAIDALHLWRSGGRPEDLAGVPPEKLYVVQLCDGPLARPEGEALYHEMRAGRLLPGEGEFDLAALLRAMPADAEIEAEVPDDRHAHLLPAARAARVWRATSAFLERQHHGATA